MPVAVTIRKLNNARRPARCGLLTRQEAASYLGISVSALAHWSCHGRGPQKMLIGRSTYYKIADLEGWIDSRVGLLRGR